MDRPLSPEEQAALAEIELHLESDFPGTNAKDITAIRHAEYEIQMLIEQGSAAVNAIPKSSIRGPAEIAIIVGVTSGATEVLGRWIGFPLQLSDAALITASAVAISTSIKAMVDKRFKKNQRILFNQKTVKLRKHGHPESAIVMSFLALRERPHAFRDLATKNALKRIYVETAELGNGEMNAYAIADLQYRTREGLLGIDVLRDLLNEATKRLKNDDKVTALALSYMVGRSAPKDWLTRPNWDSLFRPARDFCRMLDPEKTLRKIWDRELTEHQQLLASYGGKLDTGR